MDLVYTIRSCCQVEIDYRWYMPCEPLKSMENSAKHRKGRARDGGKRFAYFRLYRKKKRRAISPDVFPEGGEC